MMKVNIKPIIVGVLGTVPNKLENDEEKLKPKRRLRLYNGRQ